MHDIHLCVTVNLPSCVKVNWDVFVLSLTASLRYILTVFESASKFCGNNDKFLNCTNKILKQYKIMYMLPLQLRYRHLVFFQEPRCRRAALQGAMARTIINRRCSTLCRRVSTFPASHRHCWCYLFSQVLTN